MTRQELYQLLEKGPVFLDGATGTMLQEESSPVSRQTPSKARTGFIGTVPSFQLAPDTYQRFS